VEEGDRPDVAEPVIALDAMGGDNAPGEIVKGAVQAARELGVHVALVGPSERLVVELCEPKRRLT